MFGFSSKKRRLSRRSFRINLKKSTIFSVGSILFLVLAGLVILSFTRQGIILIKLNLLLLEMFGWTTIFLPFIFIVAGLMLSRFKFTVAEPNVLVGAVLLLLSMAGLTRSGKLGLEIWLDTSSLITVPGTILILVGGVLISLIVLFNTSFDQVMYQLISFIQMFKDRFVGFGRTKPKTIRDLQPILDEPTRDINKNLFKPKEAVISQTLQPNNFQVSDLPIQNKIWQFPPLSLLSETNFGKADRGDIKTNANIIEKTLDSFGISARVAEVNKGPAVTQYALEVALGTKLSKVTALSNDLALALAAPTGQIRIEAPIPGKSMVGIELPNRTPEFVPLKKILEADVMRNQKSKLAVALGLDVSGRPLVADISRMPHILIAGATGSGKTICLNAFVASMLFRATPNEVRFILVDPKRVELVQYNNIPHLLTPVIVEPDKVISALKWAISEMERRYKLFAEAGVRNIEAYNELSGFIQMYYIVIMIDELADIMLFAPAEVEDNICRIAQMARATGIHLVVATQRPSVEVLTGLIKANIPCRISFAVSSMIDSRVILDQPGAEKLLGRGDMLFIPPDQAKPTRIQGAFVSDPEIQKLIDYLRKQASPSYTEEVTTQQVTIGKNGRRLSGDGEARDNLFEEALRTVCQYDRASASLLQRRLSIGYARAARILDQLEGAGIVGAADSSKAREVLIRNPDEFLTPSSET